MGQYAQRLPEPTVSGAGRQFCADKPWRQPPSCLGVQWSPASADKLQLQLLQLVWASAAAVGGPVEPIHPGLIQQWSDRCASKVP